MAALPSFEQLLLRNQTMVFSIAFHALRNRSLAEELAQEVFLSLHQNLHSLDSEEHVRNWLRRAAANRAIDEIRKLKHRKGPSLVDVAEPSADAKLADPLELDQLRRMVAALPPLARMLTILRFQEDLQPMEIAEQLSMPVATVKSKLHRTLRLLRGKMTRPSLVERKGA
jgi:RNA polymerase sigma-70 factor, ECF subfamily